jgi:hypothetical protein
MKEKPVSDIGNDRRKTTKLDIKRIDYGSWMDSVGSGLGNSKLLLNPQEETCSVITVITSVFTRQKWRPSKNTNFNQIFYS